MFSNIKNKSAILQQPIIIHSLVFCFFTITTIIAAWPVVTQLDTVIIGDDPDVYINPWADWWTLKAWQDPNTTLWETDYLFVPRGASLAFHSFSHLNTLVSLLLRPLFGTLPAYNITILLNVILTGVAMYQLAQYLTKSIPAGLLAGIVFAFNSHNLYQTAHPVLISIWCFPWVTLYFMRAVRENRIGLGGAAAVFVLLGAATSTLLVILLAMWMITLILYMFIASEWPHPSWRLLLVFGGLSTLFVLPFVLPLLREAIFNQNSSFITVPTESISTNLVAFITPHWLYWPSRGVYLGFFCLYLVFLAYGYQRQQARLWFWLMLIAALFMIGPKPQIIEYELPITLPWSLWIAPFLRNMYRISILFTLGLGMVAAYGWLGMSSQLKTPKIKTIALLIMLVAIYAEYAASTTRATPVPVSPFYSEYLPQVSEEIALAALPTGRQEDKQFLYYQTIHEHKLVGGVISRASIDTFDFIYSNPLLRAGTVGLEPVPIPDDVTPSLNDLAAANVGYLVLDKTLFKEEIEHWRSRIPFEPLYEDGLLLVYATGLPIPKIPQLTPSHE